VSEPPYGRSMTRVRIGGGDTRESGGLTAGQVLLESNEPKSGWKAWVQSPEGKQ